MAHRSSDIVFLWSNVGCKTPEAPEPRSLLAKCAAEQAKDCAFAENADHVVLITTWGGLRIKPGWWFENMFDFSIY